MELQFPGREAVAIGSAQLAEGSPLETAWDVLERFGRSLQAAGAMRDQIRLILESVRASLQADVVFWEPGVPGSAVESLGRVDLPAEWYRTFVAQLLAEENGTPAHVLRPRLSPRGDGPLPRSAALVRISRSHGSWLGALSFNSWRVFSAGDIKVMLLARRMLINHRQQAQAQEKLREALFGLVHCLTAAIDAKDPYTWGHSERVARIAVRLGEQMNLAPSASSDLYLAGLLHDIGKIGIRDSVLQKPGKLTEEEFEHIKLHVTIGDRLVSNIEPLQHLRPGVRNHHERWDGKGYPDGLAGESIPLQARILAVADSCDAMMAARPYRAALLPPQIDVIMANGAGSQWDPNIIKHFLACRHELYSICQRGLGNSVIEAVDRVLERIRPLDESSSQNGAPLPAARPDATRARSSSR
jgi:HD-GYP domain-containing protein (c-di-GMP phosphodiesterase class II)